MLESRLPAILLGITLSLVATATLAVATISQTAIGAALTVAGTPGDTQTAPATLRDNPLIRQLSGRIAGSLLDDGEPHFTASEPEPITPPPTHTLRVMLDWYINPYHAALIVARERGLFDQEGLDVSLIAPADPSVPAKLVAADRAELALISQPLLHRLVDRGLPLIRVGTLVPVPLSGILFRKDRDIATLADLKGKTLGYAIEDEAKVLLDGMLDRQRIDLSDIQLKRVDFALSRALASGDVDAIVGTLRPMDRRSSAPQGVTTQEFSADESPLPLHDALIMVANADDLGEHRRDIGHFLDAVEQATVWLVKHPQVAWDLIRKAEPALDTPDNAAAWPTVIRYLALRPDLLQPRRYQRFEAYLKARGLIDDVVPVSQLAVEIAPP